jgi:hypothetical protein
VSRKRLTPIDWSPMPARPCPVAGALDPFGHNAPLLVDRGTVHAVGLCLDDAESGDDVEPRLVVHVPGPAARTGRRR